MLVVISLALEFIPLGVKPVALARQRFVLGRDPVVGCLQITDLRSHVIARFPDLGMGRFEQQYGTGLSRRTWLRIA